MIEIIESPGSLAITQRQKTEDIKIDGKDWKRTKVTLECRNPVYANLGAFYKHMFLLYDKGFTLSMERHSPWFYPFRITMEKLTEVEVTNTVKELAEAPLVVNKDGETTKDLMAKEKSKKAKKVKTTTK